MDTPAAVVLRGRLERSRSGTLRLVFGSPGRRPYAITATIGGQSRNGAAFGNEDTAAAWQQKAHDGGLIIERRVPTCSRPTVACIVESMIAATRDLPDYTAEVADDSAPNGRPGDGHLLVVGRPATTELREAAERAWTDAQGTR